MKVKANYSISCDKGSFLTGETFEIDAKDLPMYGDAVMVVGGKPATTAPVKEESAKTEEKPEEEVPKTEKSKAPVRRRYSK